jgi:hypothetical protein
LELIGAECCLSNIQHPHQFAFFLPFSNMALFNGDVSNGQMENGERFKFYMDCWHAFLPPSFILSIDLIFASSLNYHIFTFRFFIETIVLLIILAFEMGDFFFNFLQAKQYFFSEKDTYFQIFAESIQLTLKKN